MQTGQCLIRVLFHRYPNLCCSFFFFFLLLATISECVSAFRQSTTFYIFVLFFPANHYLYQFCFFFCIPSDTPFPSKQRPMLKHTQPNSEYISYDFEERGEIDVKGKGKMKTYFLHEKYTFGGANDNSLPLSSSSSLSSLHRRSTSHFSFSHSSTGLRNRFRSSSTVSQASSM